MTQTPPPPPPDNEGEGSATPPPPPPPAGPPPPAPPGYGGAAASPAGGGYDAVGAIKYGWSKFSAKPAELLVPMIVAWVATAVVLVIAYVILGALIFNTGGAHIDQSTGQLTVDQGPGYIGIVVGYAIVLLLTVLVSQFVGAAMVRGAVDVTDGQPVSLGSVWQNWDRTQVIVAGLLVAVGIAVGFVLCYIPGIIFGFLSQYTLYFVVDQKMSAVDAIQASFRFTTSHLGETIVFYLLAAVVTFIGALLCGLGLLVAIPVVLVGSAYTYRVLQGQQVTPA